MKLIKLAGKYGSVVGRYAQVSDEDHNDLIKYNWICVSKSKNYYAVKTEYNSKKRKVSSVYMHRMILKLIDSKLHTDHKDHNGLNNQRDNLRVATASQNGANREKKKPGKTSTYQGVMLRAEGWCSHCKKDGKRYTKFSKTEEEAAIKYNEMAVKYHGEFANLNII